MLKTRSADLSLQPTPSWLKRWTTRMGYAACAWALLFTLEHIYWLCGGTWLLNKADMPNTESLFADNPWSYVIESSLLVTLFAILALFPLALTWQGKYIIQRNMQRIAVISGYIGMILMAAYSFATQATVLGLACLGTCALGVGVTFVRPHNQSAARWQVIVATWIFGAGMAIYGCIYIVTALLNIHAAYFLQYLVAGGMNWTIEGILFITVALLASYGDRFARQTTRTMTSQPV